MSYAVILGMLKEVLGRERVLARIDSLTGFQIVKRLTDTLNGEIDRSMRYQRAMSLIYMDVDNFKDSK